ncbi:hypothetical protein C8Q76DRAFT_789966 [Earliella scabrosa]|nr:hypothetical protein C8Q76DRAFT_789966 [Earliella scabrosa]
MESFTDYWATNGMDHLDSDTQTLITDLLDLCSVIWWRAVLQEAYLLATSNICWDLHLLLRRFVPCTHELLATTTATEAIIRGELALSFMLRADGFTPVRLEVFVGDAQFPALMKILTECPVISSYLFYRNTTAMPATFAHAQDIHRIADFCTTSGHKVVIAESATLTGCSPLSRTWCSGLMNFVTEHLFGCAYPTLTCNKLALVSDLHVPILMGENVLTLARMTDVGFRFGTMPHHLPLYAHLANSHALPGIYTCIRTTFNCPDQGRYFGDKGSVIAFLAPLQRSAAKAKAAGIAPFGWMTIWRLWTSGACHAGCAEQDPVIPPHMQSLLCFADSAVYLATVHQQTSSCILALLENMLTLPMTPSKTENVEQRAKTEPVSSTSQTPPYAISRHLLLNVVVHIAWYSDFGTLLHWRKTSRYFFSTVATILRLRFQDFIRPSSERLPQHSQTCCGRTVQ